MTEKTPVSTHQHDLNIMGLVLKCHVLDNGEWVIEADSMAELLQHLENGDAAFTGFKSLPRGNGRWWKVLGVSMNASFEQVNYAYKEKAFEHHPDRGGDPLKMAEINNAMETARIAAGV